MNTVSNFLVKTDCLCDYVPLVSSATNLVDLFQKCVVLPLMDKSKIASSHYYKHLDQKSFFRCFLLVIPVVGNIIVGIYDFSKKKCDDCDDIDCDDIDIDKSTISLDDVEKIDIDAGCLQSWPCQHQSTIFLKDGRKSSRLNSYDICSIVSNISEERINPGKNWDAKDVKTHFSQYSKFRPDLGWEPQSAEKVLNKIFLGHMQTYGRGRKIFA
jgi:hypothetical protein